MEMSSINTECLKGFPEPAIFVLNIRTQARPGKTVRTWRLVFARIQSAWNYQKRFIVNGSRGGFSSVFLVDSHPSVKFPTLRYKLGQPSVNLPALRAGLNGGIGEATPTGIEPAHPASEADALSTELRGLHQEYIIKIKFSQRLLLSSCPSQSLAKVV